MELSSTLHVCSCLTTRGRKHKQQVAAPVFLLLSVTVLLASAAGPPVEQIFTNSLGTDINHIVVDPDTGQVYVGAVNIIYCLDSNLQPQQMTMTGPKLDNEICIAGTYGLVTAGKCFKVGSSTEVAMELEDNVNRILAISKHKQKLISCGTVYHGACTMHSLTNIGANQTYYNTPKHNIGGARATSTIGFVAPGPASTGDTGCLYVATVLPDKPSDTQIGGTAISSRNINTEDEDIAFTVVNDVDTENFLGTYEKFQNPKKKKVPTATLR